jgi:acetylornithine deacetylase/succinyl-diaminopimelate desuccinylase-like protein
MGCAEMNSISPRNLLEPANSYQIDLLTFLQALVRIPSVNGRDSEKTVAERILEEAHRLNLPAQLSAKDPDRPNALVTLGQGKKGFALIGHMDTVAEGKPEDWKHPPFLATVENGLLFGRGAADNKAGLACGLYTLALLRDSGLLDLDKHQVTLTGVVDEESGASSTLGVRHLLDSGELRAFGAIYTYTSDIVCIGHRGLLRVEITTHGTSSHAGLSEWANRQQGDNAVTGLAEILLELEKMELPFPPHAGFEHLGSTITPGTLISGGDYPSIVPNKATAMVDIRLMPGQSAEDVLDRIDRVIQKVCKNRPGLSAEKKITVNFPGAAIPSDHPLVTIAQDFTEIFTGHRWDAKGAGPGNEGYMLIGAGIPTLCGFGPTGGNPHAPDEWVEIKSLPITIAIYAGIIMEYLEKYKGE